MAHVWINDIAIDEAYANARLIAAAPEMLAVLNLALVSLEKDGPASAAAVLNTHGRAAIAKAEGRS